MSETVPFAVSLTLGFIAAFICLENSVVWIVILYSRKLRTFTNGFILSLALSDILVGGAFIPGYLANPFHKMNGYLTAVILLANVCNIFAVTYERNLAVLQPLHYAVKMTKYFLVIILLTWITPVIVSLIPLAWSAEKSSTQHNIYLGIVFLFCVIAPYVFMIYTYSRIYHEVCRQLAEEVHLQRTRIHGEWKVTRVFAAVAILFAIGWLPVLYMTICDIAERLDLIPPALSIAGIYMLSLNSMVNPWVYVLLKSDVRAECKRLYQRLADYLRGDDRRFSMNSSTILTRSTAELPTTQQGQRQTSLPTVMD